MRYTLDESKTIERYGETLLNVLDNGEPTEAFAKSTVSLSDDCEIRGGVFRGGEFHGGVFRGGVFHDGWFHGGVFRGGVFHDGWFHGGEFHGGVFRGGVFRGGWLILQIQGSKHFVNIPNGTDIKIGCQCHDGEYWLKNFERIGKIEGYSDDQIAEYKMYIDLAIKTIESNQ